MADRKLDISTTEEREAQHAETERREAQERVAERERNTAERLEAEESDNCWYRGPGQGVVLSFFGDALLSDHLLAAAFRKVSQLLPGLFQGRHSLAEGESDQAPTRIRDGVEGRARDGGYARFLGQVPGEGGIRLAAEFGVVGEDVVSALGLLTLEARVHESIEQDVSSSAVVIQHAGVVLAV